MVASRSEVLQELSVDVAIRLDPATSTTEEAGFFGAAPGRLFGAFVLPTRPASAAVLISSSLYAEQARNYRREVILARALARRGIASFHYHYRGTGHSDGDPSSLTFDSMVADAGLAVEILRERVPGVPLGFLGTRLGGFVGASAAGEAPTAPLALWDPLTDASIAFRDAMKAGRAGGMVSGTDPETASGVSQNDPWAEGYLDSVGFRIPRVLRDSFDDVSIPACLGTRARRVWITTVVARHERTTQAETVAERLREETAATVTVKRLDGRLNWWTSRDSWDPDEDHPVTGEVTSSTAAWLAEHLEGPDGS